MSLVDVFYKPNGQFDKRLQFEVITIFVIIIWFLTFYFKQTYGYIVVLLIFAYFIANSYVEVQKQGISDNNKQLMIKLNKLESYYHNYLRKQKLVTNKKLDSMYMDANLISFLESITELNEYNDRLYFFLLNGTNNILRIKKDIDTFYESNGEYPENTSELFEIAIELKSKCLNHLHDFIYKLPKATRMYKYLTTVMQRYQVLIYRVLDSIHESYKKNHKQRGINSSSKYVIYSTVQPMETKSIKSSLQFFH